MKKMLIILSSLKDKRDLYSAERAADYISGFHKKAKIELLFVIDSDMLEGAIMANDEFFGVKERREFITKGAMEKAEGLLDEAAVIFEGYGMKPEKKVEIGEPREVIFKNGIGSDTVLLLTEKLQKKSDDCPCPVVTIPEMRPTLGIAGALKGILHSEG